ncbi:hypothetical protein LTR93_009233 [Exophiala xenobiotica]|nr:hypothetical protein LTR93_009233 [Exophiala xenobiotica]
MGRDSPQGLTASDFHHQPYVNPLDVFPTKTRLAGRTQTYRSPIRGQVSSQSPARYPTESLKFGCCGENGPPSFRPSSGLNNYMTDDSPGSGLFDVPPSSNSRNGSLHTSPSPMDCEDCMDDCDDCVEEHERYHQQDDTPDQFVDDCQECNEAQIDHQHNGPACTDACDECDFSCFDCIDWNDFEHDKSLGLSFSVPLLGDNSFPEPEPEPQFDEIDLLNFQEPDFSNMQPSAIVPPLDVPMHHQCLGSTIPYWDNLVQAQLCTGTPGLAQQYPLPPFGLEFGCHPATAHQQLPLPDLPPLTTNPNTYLAAPQADIKQEPQHLTQPTDTPLAKTSDLLAAITAPPTSRSCQWLMPCGTVCGASFASATDLKKHLKAVHLVKGVTKCSWQSCDSATFASEAALTGHISKKHLAPMLAASAATPSSNATKADGTSSSANASVRGEGGPFKCSFPGCLKSFMYKQVRDEHVASCHQGNKMYCHICGQYLNGEGSNFKRHMATHRPKHQHMLCKFHGLGYMKLVVRLERRPPWLVVLSEMRSITTTIIISTVRKQNDDHDFMQEQKAL